MRELANGLFTGLALQFAIGPVFFFIVNLVLQRSILDGFAGVIAVTLVDYTYICLAIFGIGKLLKHNKFIKAFGVVSSIILMIFGLLIIKGVIIGRTLGVLDVKTTNIFTSFTSVFLLSISSPMTIVFFTSLFTAKAMEYNYTKNELLLFGLGTGLATFLFMGLSVVLFSQMKGTIPVMLVQILNGIVGCLLIGYGGFRILKNFQ